MNQVLSAIYYLPNAFLFYETTAEDNDKLLDNNLETNNIIQEQKIAEKKPQLTTKYVNKILIKNTERIILWNGFNLTWWNHLTLYKSLKEMRKNGAMNNLKYEKSNYIFEFLSSFFSISYINRTKGKFGLYWKVDLFDNYAGFHNFNQKCTRGLLGLYIGVYHNYFINKNIQIGYHIGIGMCIQRYYALCLGNRLIGGLNKNIKNKYYTKTATENEKEKAKDNNVLYNTNINIKNGIILPTNNAKFYLSEILMNPFSYYNADLIVDLGALNVVHKSGFVFNINWKIGVVNTVLIFRNKNTSFNGKFMHLLYNVSIGFGYDLNKAIEKIEKD